MKSCPFLIKHFIIRYRIVLLRNGVYYTHQNILCNQYHVIVPLLFDYYYLIPLLTPIIETLFSEFSVFRVIDPSDIHFQKYKQQLKFRLSSSSISMSFQYVVKLNILNNFFLYIRA